MGVLKDTYLDLGLEGQPHDTHSSWNCRSGLKDKTIAELYTAHVLPAGF